MTDLIPFSYGDRPVRTVQVDGEPWFVAADVCAVLDPPQVRVTIKGIHELHKRLGGERPLMLGVPA